MNQNTCELCTDRSSIMATTMVQVFFQTFCGLMWISGISFTIYFYFTNGDGKPKTLSLAGVYSYGNAESDFLGSLGFRPEPRLYPLSHHENTELPVFVIALHSKDLYSFHRFLGSFRVHFRTKRLLVYDIGLSSEDRSLVQHTCQCLVRNVYWERYPPHIQDMRTKAYRPLLIQETLQEFGAVFWCHPAMRFQTSDLQSISIGAKIVGITTWRARKHPTSALTHPHTFRYLGLDSSRYHHLPMAEPDMALYFNTYQLHSKLMLPWVKCAIDKDCIDPPGAKSTECKMNLPKWYAYTGCHLYDSAVFNALLGVLFKYDSSYIAKQKLFLTERV